MSALDDHFVEFEASRLLVADDDPILREFATVHLATPSVEVEVAEDGVVALDMLKSGRFDLALVDLDMPRMDGFELIHVIRADAVLCHLPIVVVTGREDMIAVDRAYAEGATSFVVKPLNWRVLSHQLAYVLRNCRVEAKLRAQLAALKANQVSPSATVHALHDRVAHDAFCAIATAARRLESATQDAMVKAASHDIARLSQAVQSLRTPLRVVE